MHCAQAARPSFAGRLAPLLNATDRQAWHQIGPCTAHARTRPAGSQNCMFGDSRRRCCRRRLNPPRPGPFPTRLQCGRVRTGNPRFWGCRCDESVARHPAQRGRVSAQRVGAPCRLPGNFWSTAAAERVLLHSCAQLVLLRACHCCCRPQLEQDYTVGKVLGESLARAACPPLPLPA